MSTTKLDWLWANWLAILVGMLVALAFGINWNMPPPTKFVRHPCADSTTVFNRQAEVHALKPLFQPLILDHPLLIVNGPPVSGKSTLISSVLLELSETVFCVNLYDGGVLDYDTLTQLFDDRVLKFVDWVKETHRDPSIRAWISEKLGIAPAVEEPYLEMAMALASLEGMLIRVAEMGYARVVQTTKDALMRGQQQPRVLKTQSQAS